VAIAAVLLATLSAVLVASAAPKHATAQKHRAAPSARTMSYACAFDLYNAKKVLHFAARPASCTGSGQKLVRWNPDYPVYTCRKEHGGFAGQPKRFQFPSGIYGHGPAGLMRLVSSTSQCAPKSQPNETPHALPLTTRDQMFCAAKNGGELRWISNSSACNRREFRVRLKKVSGFPVAGADSANTDEDHGTSVNVLANDRNTPTSHSNAGLQVASTDTTGTKGAVSVNPDGTIAYNPNGQFESLKVGQSATDTFKYRVKRGGKTSAPATVTIRVAGVNDLPVAHDDSATTDSAHTKSIPVLANDSDADGDALSVSVDTSGTQGNVTVNPDGTVTYDPNHKFDSLGPNDSAHDTFKYKANDGHGDSNVATVDVTIGGLDDPPAVTTSSGSTAYTEGDPATVIDGGVTVGDPDSAHLQSASIKIADGHNINDVLELPTPAPGGITAFYDSGAGVLSLTGDASQADWQAALRTVTFRSASDNPFPTKKLDFTVNDGNSDSSVSTKTITTTNVNDAPHVQTSGGTSDFVEDSPPVTVDPGIDVSDPDSLQLQSATVAITANFSSADGDTLSFSDQNGIHGSYDSSTGVLTLTGVAAISDYQAAIQSITFSNTSNTPSTADRTVSITVKDAEGLDSNTDTKTVTVTAHNDAPVATADSNSTNEDTPLSVGAPGVLSNDSDAEGSPITAVLVSGPAHASSFALNSDGSYSYTPAQDYFGPDSFTYKPNDGTDDGNTVTVSLTVNPVNDAPVTDLNGTGTPGIDTTAAFTEDAGAVSVAPAADVSDVDDTNLESATITLTNHPNNALEVLAVSTAGTSITASSYDSSTGVITLSGSDTKAHYQQVIRSLTYDNSSNTPDITDRVVNVKVNDGDLDSATAKSTISVTPHNDAPTAVADGPFSTNEDTTLAALAPGVLGNDTDPENDSLTAVLVTGPAHASSFTLNSDGSYSYTPAQDYFGPDSFTYKANDGSNDSNTVTVSLNVDSVNDAPVVDLDTTSGGNGSTTTFNEVTTHDNSVAVAPNADVTDVDDTNIESASITLVNHPDNAAESLAVDTTGTVITASSYDSTTGVITLSGSDTKAHYAQVIKSLTYSNTAAPPNPADRHIDVKVNDGDLDSATATATVQVVPIDAPPVVDLNGGGVGIDNSASFTEDSPAVAIAPSATVTDIDSPNLVSATVTLTNHPDLAAESLTADTTGTSITTTGYNSTTGVLSLTGTDTLAHYQQVIQSAKYDNSSNTPDPTQRDISVVVNDGQKDSPTATSHVSVTPHNDAPTLDLNGASAGSDATAAFTEDQPSPTTLAPNTIAADVDSANLQSATITLTNHPDNAAESLTVDTSGTSISAVAYNSGTGVLSLSGSDTVANYQKVLRTVGYNNSSQNANATNRVVNFVVNDGSSDSNSPTSTVTITVVNDPPVVDMNGGGSGIDSNAAFTEDSAPAHPGSGPVNLGSSATVSDVDNANLSSATITLTNHPDGAAESLSVNLAGTSITTGGYNGSTGVLTLTGPDTTAHFQQVIQSAQYNNTSNTPDPTNRDVTIKANDGAADSTVAHTTVTVTPTDDPPVANADTFNSTNSAVGNTTLNVNDNVTTGAGAADGRPATPDPTDTSPATDRPHKEITGNIFANDTDPDNPSSGFTATAGTFPTNDGGSVTIQADGDFNFEPAPSTSCTDHSDFFSYTLNDNSTGGNATSTGTVTVAISGCVWYANNGDAEGNSGTSEKPFDTVAQAQTASGTSDSIFVYQGKSNTDTTGYNTGISLKASQQLIGEAADLVVGSDSLHSADSSNKPTLTNNNADVVSLANANVVKGLNIDPQGTGGGICGGTACGGNATAGGTLDDVNITDTGTKGTQAGLELNGSTGTFNISNLTVNNGDGSAATTGDEGVKLNNAGTVNFASTGTISITTNGAAGLDAAAGGGTTSLGSASTFDDITVTNSGNGGVLLNGTTGSGTAFGDGSGTDLSLTTTQGSAAAFSAQTAGSFSIPSAGQSDVTATGGPAVDVVSSSGSTMAFDSVSSTNSANDGVNLDSLGTGTFSATSGSIGGEAGIGFDVNGGSGAITYPGTFANGSGPLVAEVTGRTGTCTAGVGSCVTLSGSMNDTNDAGGGVNVANNTGGQTVLSGATKQFNTGASDAVDFTNSDGHTLAFSGGGLDIDTTSGNGLNATSSGTLQVTNTGNTIDSTALSSTNRGLNVVDTDFAAAGATFDHISTSGGADGIRLNNTGSSGHLAVTGTGGTCTAADQSGCTGGTIQNATGADDSGTSPIGTAIALKSTQDTSLTRMHILNSSNYAIRGDSVPGGFNLANSVIDGVSGTEAPASAGSPFNESAIRFTELSGTGNNITSSAISGGVTDNVGVINSTGTLNRLTLQSDTFGNNSNTEGNRNIDVVGTGTATTNVTVDSSTFTASRSHDFGFDNTGAGGDVVFTNNTMSNSRPATGPNAQAGGAGNVKVTSGASSAVTLNVATNTMRDADGNAMLFVHDVGGGSLSGTVNGNTIGVAATANSGSIEGDGIQFNETGGTAGSHSTLAITNNVIRQYNDFGIELASGSSGLASETGNIDATVTGNTISNPGNNASISSIFQGIQLNTATVDGQSFNWCANIKGNSIIGSGRNGGTDFRLRQRFDTVVRLPGYGGTAFDTAAVTAFMQNQNDANPNSTGAEAPTPSGAALTDQPSGGQGFVGGAACASG
jgi:Bacterial Ig domain/Bacterial cadherin-like domain